MRRGALASAQELEDFEQELVDQYLLAAVGAGLATATVGGDRAVIFEFIRFLGRPVWTARPATPTGSWRTSGGSWAGRG